MVGQETAIGFFHENSSPYPCNIFIVSLSVFFHCKRSGNLSDLKTERGSKLQILSCF